MCTPWSSESLPDLATRPAQPAVFVNLLLLADVALLERRRKLFRLERRLFQLLSLASARPFTFPFRRMRFTTSTGDSSFARPLETSSSCCEGKRSDTASDTMCEAMSQGRRSHSVAAHGEELPAKALRDHRRKLALLFRRTVHLRPSRGESKSQGNQETPPCPGSSTGITSIDIATGSFDVMNAHSQIARNTPSAVIVVQNVIPCVTAGSSFPSQQSTSTCRQPYDTKRAHK